MNKKEEAAEKDAAEKLNVKITAKVNELSKKEDCEIYPIVITVSGGEKVVGYLREMSVDLLLFTQDKLVEKPVRYSDIGEAILRDCLIVEDSDPRIASEERKHAKIRASFMLSSVKMATPYADEYKKK